MLTAMPGVVNTPHIAELCFEKFREKRKGRELWLELLEPTTYTSPNAQTLIVAKLASCAHSANDPRTPCPIPLDCALESLRDYLENYLLTWRLKHGNSDAKPFEFVNTVSKIIEKHNKVQECTLRV